MKTVAEKIRELKEKEGQIKGMGGAKAVEKQRLSGKLTARERLDLFFDPGTFRETDIFVTHRCVNFGMEQVEIPADGVVTGFGRVNGRPVFAFAQDFTSRAGSLGEMHSKKICKVMDLALKAGVPFVGFNDSGGARIQEGVDSLSRLRADFLPQRHRQRGDPPDLRHHGPHRRGRGLLPGHDGLHLHGEEHLLHVHHRARRHQERHRGGDQLRGLGRRHGPQHEVRGGPLRLRVRRRRHRPDQAPA